MLTNDSAVARLLSEREDARALACRLESEIARLGAAHDALAERLAAVTRERDAWGGKACSADAEALAFKHQRDEAVGVLGAVLAEAEKRTSFLAPPPSIVKARELVELYQRAAALREEPTP